MQLTPTLLGFLTQPDYQTPPYLLEIEQECLQLFNSTTVNRLLLQCPVRHGKSWFACYILVAWYLLTHPENHVIIASHTVSFSAEWSSRVRDVIIEYGEALTGVTVHPKCRGADYWRTSAGGSCRAVGVGGSCAGFTAQLIIADDLHSDQFSVESPSQRRKMETWMAAELLTRLTPPNPKVITIGSSRHPEDIWQTLLRQNPDLPPELRWKHIKFPAINDKGEALWPQRISIEWLNNKRKELADQGQEYIFNNLYLQKCNLDPRVVEWPEDYFKGLFYTNITIDKRCSVLSFDPSKGSKDELGDFPAIIYAEYGINGILYIEDAWMMHAPLEQAEDVFVRWLNEKRPTVAIVETVGFQSLVVDNIMRKNKNGFITNFMAANPKEPKESRIRLNLGPLLDRKKLKVRDCIGNRIGFEQLKNWPSSSHDDWPDAVAQCIPAINKIIGK